MLIIKFKILEFDKLKMAQFS